MMTVGLRTAALGPGDLGPMAQDNPGLQARLGAIVPAGEATLPGSAETARAPAPAGMAQDAGGAEERPFPAELIAPQPPEPRDGEAGSDLAVARPEAGGAVKTYAQIPMEVIEVISRLREEAAQAQVAGVPGRNDPTPMPARPEAIGARVPYDAA